MSQDSGRGKSRSTDRHRKPIPAGLIPTLTAQNGSKKAAEVARLIESDIMRRGWPLGELLGSEPDLIARYGVSRAVFREAVRIVEHDGAARMRRGPGGGLIVTAPNLDAVEVPATLYLDYSDVSPQDLYDVRSALELTCTGVVAENIDESGITRLREALDLELAQGGDLVETGRSHDLHVVLADLTGNPAMRLFVESLTRLTYERVGHLHFDAEDLRGVHGAHEAIVDAIVSGDAALAQHRMRKHLVASASYYYQRQRSEERKTAARSPVRAREAAVPSRRGRT